jgi:hypothetical protein
MQLGRVDTNRKGKQKLIFYEKEKEKETKTIMFI